MKALVVLLFIVSVGIFAWFSRTCCDGDFRIERELSANAKTGLSRTDLSDVTVSVDRLDVVLKGTVEKGKRKQLVREVAGSLRGGRVIDLLNEVEPESPSLSSTVFFERKGSQVLLSGRVSNDTLKQRVAEIVYQMPVVRAVVNSIEVSERAWPLPDARLIASFGAVFMKESEQGFFEWSPEKFVMRGEVPSAAVKSRIEDQVEPLLHGRTLENHLTVRSAAAEGVSCVIAKEADGREEGYLRGNVGSAELRAQAVLAAREADPEVLWRDELSVAPERKGYSTAMFPKQISAFLAARAGQAGGFSQGPSGIAILGVSDRFEQARWKEILEKPRESGESEFAGGDIEVAMAEDVGTAQDAVSPTDQQEATKSQNESAVQLKAGLGQLAVYFGTNQETANLEELRKVAQAHRLLTEAGYEGKLVVAGYDDARRNAAYNKALSLRRAESIKAELVKMGLTSSLIEVESFGVAEGVKPDADVGNERCVEIHLRD